MAFTTWSTTDLVNVTLSGGNLIATSPGSGGVRGKDPKRTGKYYIEYTSTTTQSTSSSVGFAAKNATLWPGQNAAIVQLANGGTRAWSYDGTASINGSGTVYTTGSIVGCAIDLDNARVWFRLSPAGIWNNNAANNPTTGIGGIDISATGVGRGIDAYPFTVLSSAGNSITANFGASAFSGAVPSGFTSGWDDSVGIVTSVVSTQIAAEQWASIIPPQMQATQVAIEQWTSTANVTTRMLMTQEAIEQWSTVALAGAITARQAAVTVVT